MFAEMAASFCYALEALRNERHPSAASYHRELGPIGQF
jgi:hypothetical protein